MQIDDILSANLTVDEWENYFGDITFREFEVIVSSVVKSPSVSLKLLTAIAKKFLYYGHFGDNLSEDFRLELIGKADFIMDHLIATSNDEMRSVLQNAWAVSKDHCARFGYTSGAIYEVLAPHRVFQN